jgi:translocation and assembly module TamA
VRRLARACIAALALLLALGLGACASKPGDEAPLPDETAGGPPVATIDYDVAFEPAAGGKELPPRLADFLAEASRSRQLTSRPPASELIIRRRALDDLPVLTQAMRSLGYYDGRIDFEIRRIRPQPPPADAAGELAQKVKDLTEGAPTRLVFLVTPGPLYHLAKATIRVEGAPEGYAPPAPADIGLVKGDPAAAERVLGAEQKLLAHARDDGRPLAGLGKREAVVDHPTRTMEVTLAIDPGPRADFGPVTFKGDDGIRETFLRRRLPFKPGERYDAAQLDKARLDLIQTSLFASVIVRTPDHLDAAGQLPVTFDLTQRAQRSIGAGVGYQSDEGLGGNVFWEHRNFFHGGEKLRAEIAASQVKQSARLTLAKPDFLIPRLSLLNEAEASHEDTDAYESTSLSVGTGVQYAFTPKLLGSIGVNYRYADIDDQGDEQTYGLLSFPTQADWDFSDNLLDPTTGGRLVASAAPFFDTLGTGTRFYRGQITATRYIPILADHKLILALRGSLGALTGADRAEIPADERFYSGGGGSVRGIGYQLAGPVDDKNKPIGGRSLAEFSTEFRTRITESIGAVAFLDGGTVYDSEVPDFSDELHLGTGVGLRYITAIGPIRFDVGVPINRRSDVDDAYQLYISIGQAF